MLAIGVGMAGKRRHRAIERRVGAAGLAARSAAWPTLSEGPGPPPGASHGEAPANRADRGAVPFVA